jgi:hypothetical protein
MQVVLKGKQTYGNYSELKPAYEINNKKEKKLKRNVREAKCPIILRNIFLPFSVGRWK